VNLRLLPVERGMTEGGDIELTAAHQAQDDDRQYLNHHTDFDVAGTRQSHKFTGHSYGHGMHHKWHLLHGKIIVNLHNFR
jgi:hypothetical protein